MQKQTRAFGRGAAERADRRASELGRGEGQHHRNCRGTGTQRAGVIPSALTSSPIASVIQATSFLSRGTATQGRDGRALGMLKGVMWQPDRHVVCPAPPSTRFVSWQLPRQTLPDVQNFLSFTMCSALGSTCGFRQY